MRTFEFTHASRPSRPQKLWVAETLVVLGIVAFGLFALALEGQFNPLAKPANTVELPFELTR
jgi:hypothetical protein